jgi:predicted O-linked N-acetylglucosamine transferase (SPINDLY family)
MDYIIADQVVIPEKNQKFFKEKIIYLPSFYQISNDKKKYLIRITLIKILICRQINLFFVVLIIF